MVKVRVLVQVVAIAGQHQGLKRDPLLAVVLDLVSSLVVADLKNIHCC